MADPALEPVLHLHHQPLGGLLTHSRQLDQGAYLFAFDAQHELGGGHAGEDGQRQLGTNPVGLDQLAKQRPLLLVIEAIEQLGIFPHHEVGVDGRLLADLGQIIEAAHGHLYLIAHAPDFQQYLGGLFLNDYASQATNHGNLLTKPAICKLAHSIKNNWISIQHRAVRSGADSRHVRPLPAMLGSGHGNNFIFHREWRIPAIDKH